MMGQDDQEEMMEVGLHLVPCSLLHLVHLFDFILNILLNF